MADEKIVIDGEQYISSGRAASLVGYTKDYVGQLARDGKVKATRVGRNWYINESSINKHKLSVHYTLTKPKKKQEADNTEKSTDYIDNLDTVSNESQANTYEKRDKQATETHRENDLFPKPQKPSRDALLHTDVRYEEDPVPKAEKYTGKKKANNNETFGSVKIRRPVSTPPRKKRDTSLSVRNSNRAETRKSHQPTSSAAIDGVVLTKTPERPIHKNINGIQPQKKYTYQNEVPEHMDVTRKAFDDGAKNTDRTEHKKHIEHDTHDSKVIPVIGAIIIFTLFTVVYILFFVGN